MMVEFRALVGLVMVIAQAWKKVGLNVDLIPLVNTCVG